MRRGLKNYGKWVETSIDELCASCIDLNKIPKNELKKLQKIAVRMCNDKNHSGDVEPMGELDLAKLVIDRGKFVDKDGNPITFEKVKSYVENMTLMDGLKMIDANFDWEKNLPKSKLVKNTEQLYKIDKELSKCKDILERKGLWRKGIYHIQHIGVPSIKLLFSNENRPIDIPFIKRLFGSILESGHNSNCRVIINSNNILVDGQHRALVLFLLGMPYYYITDDTIDGETISKWNKVCQKTNDIDVALQMAEDGNKVAMAYKCTIDIMADNYKDVSIIDGDIIDETDESLNDETKVSTKMIKDKPKNKTIATKLYDIALLIYVDGSKIDIRNGKTKNLYTRYHADKVVRACKYYDKCIDEKSKKAFFDVDDFIQNGIPRIAVFTNWMKINYLPKVGKKLALTPLQEFRKDDMEVALFKLWMTDAVSYDELFIQFMGKYVLPNNHYYIVDGHFAQRKDYQNGKYDLEFVEDENYKIHSKYGKHGYEIVSGLPQIDIGKSESEFIKKTVEYICGDDLDRNLEIRKQYKLMYDVDVI